MRGLGRVWERQVQVQVQEPGAERAQVQAALRVPGRALVLAPLPARSRQVRWKPLVQVPALRLPL